MWTNPQCFGDVPSPRLDHASTIIKHKVWLFGGFNVNFTMHDDIFELNMHSLTWTQIQTVEPRPQARQWCTLSALNNNQLVLYGGDSGIRSDETLGDTWIMDLTSYSWRQYESKDHTRRSHTASVCLNNNVTIIGGCQGGFDYREKSYTSVFHVMLEAKSLQQLVVRTIYKHQDEINWTCLPNKLISLLGLSIKEKRSTWSSRVWISTFTIGLMKCNITLQKHCCEPCERLHDVHFVGLLFADNNMQTLQRRLIVYFLYLKKKEVLHK